MLYLIIHILIVLLWKSKKSFMILNICFHWEPPVCQLMILSCYFKIYIQLKNYENSFSSKPVNVKSLYLFSPSSLKRIYNQCPWVDICYFHPYSTKSHRHIVCHPFSDLRSWVELHTDANTYSLKRTSCFRIYN